MAASIPRLKRLLAAARVVAIDVGARGGFTRDLAPIAAAVDATGFEPDRSECDRLNEGARANTLSEAVLLEFQAVLDTLEREMPKGLVIRSGKPGGFIAGADVGAFRGLCGAIRDLGGREVAALRQPEPGVVNADEMSALNRFGEGRLCRGHIPR